MGKTKNLRKQYVVQNRIEQLLGIGGGVGEAGTALGEKKQEYHAGTSGDLLEGQELNFKDLHGKNSPAGEEKANIEPGINYRNEILHGEKRAANLQNQELKNQLQEIAIEIKKLTNSSKELQTQFKDVAIIEHTVTPGKYHKSFFTWMLSMIQTARTKVEDSGAWLAALHSKKKSREYGAMAKKHGTTFSLSNERVVATQVG